MRTRIVVANWKMHKDFDEGLELARGVLWRLSKSGQNAVQVILLVPFIHLEAVGQLIPDGISIFVGAQNCHEQTAGSFTGEIAAPMLRSVGARFVLTGHCERRRYFGEKDSLIAQKVTAILACSLCPIFCCGENQQNWLLGQRESYVSNQLAAGLFHLSEDQIKRVVIAYEPFWAVGTQCTPDPSQVQIMHRVVRDAVSQRYGEKTAQKIPILYGGSCDAQNVSAFFDLPDVDGVLVGRASLDLDAFVSIVDSVERLSTKTENAGSLPFA